MSEKSCLLLFVFSCALLPTGKALFERSRDETYNETTDDDNDSDRQTTDRALFSQWRFSMATERPKGWKRRWGYDPNAQAQYHEEPEDREESDDESLVADDRRTKAPKRTDRRKLLPGINPRAFPKQNNSKGTTVRRQRARPLYWSDYYWPYSQSNNRFISRAFSRK